MTYVVTEIHRIRPGRNISGNSKNSKIKYLVTSKQSVNAVNSLFLLQEKTYTLLACLKSSYETELQMSISGSGTFVQVYQPRISVYCTESTKFSQTEKTSDAHVVTENVAAGAVSSEDVQKIVAAEKEVGESQSKKPRVDLQNFPTRQYLDITVVPILLQGLSALAKERPPDPIEYLAAYLLKNKSQFEQGSILNGQSSSS
ncbi:uncharacterized protein LOC143222873 [Tachypleus tridentatus]|uniref:uncharacterized protein LOC143222873 n=1 Tax=Tachypleus tridentatus TaxID=6853 RepID=UPI003FD4A596